MGLAFDLAHHLAQQSYLGRVASVPASGHFRKLGLVTERSGLPSEADIVVIRAARLAAFLLRIAKGLRPA